MMVVVTVTTRAVTRLFWSQSGKRVSVQRPE
jgi:hypothetical protein